MATTNFTRLFSNSGLHSAQMKSTLLALLLALLIGCGGKTPVTTQAFQPRATPTPAAPTPTPPTLIAAQVFTNSPQTWEFESQCQNMQQDGSLGPLVVAHTFIQVIPQPDTLDTDGVTVIHNTDWYYTKTEPCAYWMPNSIFYEDPAKPLTELHFFMSTDASGAWYSTGGHIIAPNGFPWDTTVPRPPQDVLFSVTTNPGMPRPYLIIPAQSDSETKVVDFTTFPDAEGPNTPWETDAATAYITTPVYSGWAMESIQTEGGVIVPPSTIKCSTDNAQTGCAHEGWFMSLDGRGLQMVIPYTAGGPPLDSKSTLIRVN
jgi:hypothetical protein